MVEILMALDVARTRCTLEGATRLTVGVGHQTLDVGKTYFHVGMKQAGDQEPDPNISGARVGHEEGVIWEDLKVALRSMPSIYVTILFMP
jgi:hypothetical protein